MLIVVWCIQEEKTPLHHAAEDGHMGTLRLFLKDYHANTAVTATVSQSFHPVVIIIITGTYTCIYVSGFDKRDHFLLCIKCHYGQKHATK